MNYCRACTNDFGSIGAWLCVRSCPLTVTVTAKAYAHDADKPAD
jgi:hypothetical protein